MNAPKQKLLTDLPECLYYCFQDNLTQDDYQQLLNISKRLIHIRMKTTIFRLTEKYSLQYCEDESFRSQLLQKVENPIKQVIIKLTYSKIKCHQDLFDIFPVYVICRSSEGSDLNICLRNVKEFTLCDYTLDISTLSNVSDCENANFVSCPGITNISLLTDCRHVTLDSCENIIDCGSLGKQNFLFIYDNPYLTNVVNFRSIQTLVLDRCFNLEDVSPLRGVYDLSLITCLAVSDISSLGGHHRLEISYCNQMLSGYDGLRDIPIVKLSNCRISDISVLRNAKVLYLEDCHLVADVSSLSGVKDLTLISCSQIQDLSMITTVQKLTLSDLTKLKNYKGVNQMKNLSLQVRGLNDDLLRKFPNAKNIKLSFFLLQSILPLLPTFTNLLSLTISASSIKIQSCFDIHTVMFDDCTVKNIRGLGKNRVVRLFQCQGDVLDVSSLATVPLVSIIKCRFKRVNYESLMNVPRLKIDDCG